MPSQPGGTDGYVSTRSCIGPTEYAPESSTGPGVAVPFVMQLNYPNICLHDSTIYVDRVRIVPAMPGECP